MKRATISVDLGSAYTKIAFRAPFPQHRSGTYAERDAHVAMIQGWAMVPSIVARTGTADGPWTAGRQAAGMKPGGKVQLHQNWKPRFYSREFDENTVDLVYIAGAFFGWLLKQLRDAGVNPDNDCRVRVTFPALQSIDAQRNALRRCMVLNGWPEDITLVLEPVANMIGTFSAGRNFVTAYGQMSYAPIFGEPDPSCRDLDIIFKQVREHALGHRKARHLKVTILDCGSFTLDVATLNLDLHTTDHKELPVNQQTAKSWALGVTEQLDDICFGELFARHKLDRTSVTFEALELAKFDLYAGKEYSLVAPPRRALLGHSREDKDAIESALSTYANKIWERLSSVWDGPEIVILTGGGVCINPVRDFLQTRLESKGVTAVIHFPCDASAHIPPVGANRLALWNQTSETLGRLATALGGASVAFGFDPDEACGNTLPRGVKL